MVGSVDKGKEDCIEAGRKRGVRMILFYDVCDETMQFFNGSIRVFFFFFFLSCGRKRR